VDGGWSAWTPWSTCSVSCGNGTRVRDRQCDNPPQELGGQSCSGNNDEIETCENDCLGK